MTSLIADGEPRHLCRPERAAPGGSAHPRGADDDAVRSGLLVGRLGRSEVGRPHDVLHVVEYRHARVGGRVPFSGPSAAARKAALISSTVPSRSSTKVRSVREPSSTGTRTARPSRGPAGAGRARPTGRAAPGLGG